MKPKTPFNADSERDSAIADAYSALSQRGFVVVQPIETAANPASARKAAPAPKHGFRITATLADTLRDMAKHSGWSERGGLAIGAQTPFELSRGIKSREEMRSRTAWVGKPRWAQELGLPKVEIVQAVERAIAGERLGRRQKLCIQVMLEEINGPDDSQRMSFSLPVSRQALTHRSYTP